MNTQDKDIFINGKGIKFLLDSAYKYLDNPMVIHDMQYFLLAHSENKITDDWLWNELISTGTFSHETIEILNSLNFIADIASTDDVALLKAVELKYDRICGKLFNNKSEQMGCFTVIGCYKKFTKQDFIDIAFISDCISRELQSSEYYPQIEKLLDETFITNLINRDCAYITKKLNNIYFDLDEFIFIAVVDISQYKDMQTHLIYLKELFKNLQPEYEYFIHFSNIIILMSKKTKNLNIKTDMSKLNEFFAKYNIFAGVSQSFENILYFQNYYKQAIMALNNGLESESRNCIYIYDDFLINNLINATKNTIDLRSFCHISVIILSEYDKNNKTNYLNVLFQYLKFTKNKSLTFQYLNISQEQLDEYLNEIQNIVEIDMLDGNLLLNIAFSFKIMHILKEE